MKDLIKKHKVLFIVFAIIILLIILAAIFIIFLGKTNKPDNISKNKKVEKEEIKKVKNELDMTIEEQYDKNMYYALTTYGAFGISDYDYFTEYPEAYRDSMITFNAEITKVIEEKDNKYKIEVDYDDAAGNPLYIVVNGEYQNGVRYVEGNLYRFIGIFRGMQTHEIDGIKTVLPTMDVKRVALTYADTEYDSLFTEQELKDESKKFFNNYPMTFSRPNYTLDTTKDGFLLADLPSHYLIKLENTGNYKFDEFRIYTNAYGLEPVTDQENIDVSRFISKATDGTGYILMSFQQTSKINEIQLYDKDFKQKWSREFENADSLKFMNVNGKLVVYCNNSLYYIDEKTGKDIISPITVGNVIKLRPLSNGDVIIFTSDKTKFIQYLDSKGNIKWTNSTDYTPVSVSGLEIGNGKIYVNYYVEESEDDVYLNVYSKKGEKVATTIPNHYN